MPETQRLTSETSWILRVSESKANYWATYAVDFSLMLFFISWDGFRLGYGAYSMAGMFALGLLAWTLTEYCAHRWLYHWGFALTRSGHEKAGWFLGFIAYSFMHHSLHHYKLSYSWFRHLQSQHRIHHALPETNYGVTMRFWDRVFRTEFIKK